MNSPQRLDRKPRLLILSASSGAGHVRAAEALEQASRMCGDCDVQHVDALDCVSKIFQRAYDKAYISTVRRAPELTGVFYERRRGQSSKMCWDWYTEAVCEGRA
jgi:processive 1,2-diacylglycerol beta-glucosyltransferase